jgi:hypothetical protein
MDDHELRQLARAEIENLAAILEGSLSASGWENPADQIDFILSICIEPAVEELRKLWAQAEEPCRIGEIPELVSLPDLHEPV